MWRYFFFGLTACLSVAPGENFGAFDALILTRSPVRGFTPWRAARLTTENLPKPVMMTSSPFFNVLLTVSSSDSIAREESALERPLSEATASISWDLFMWWFLSSRCDWRAGRVPCQLLPGIEQPLGVEGALDLLVQLDRPLSPLRPLPARRRGPAAELVTAAVSLTPPRAAPRGPPVREGSEWDLELRSIAGGLSRLGIHAAPALRWHGKLYTGLDAISAALADSGVYPTLA
jgi:hypothetical protein